MAAYGVTRHGNASAGSAHGFEGKNILEFVGDMDQRPALAQARRKLFEAREKRTHPGRDDVQLARLRQLPSNASGIAKVLTSWNGLMLAAFAEATRTLDREDYQQVAEHNAEFLLRELRQENGRLLRTWKRRPERVLEGPSEGAGKAKLNGYLEDYAYLIEGLLELYQTTLEPRWFVAAQELAETMIAHFQAPQGGFFDTSDDHETLITRPGDLQDNAKLSASPIASVRQCYGYHCPPEVGWTHQRGALCRYFARGTCSDGIHDGSLPTRLRPVAPALSYALAKPNEIAIIGKREKADTQAMLRIAAENYQPFQIIALGDPHTRTPVVPLLQDRKQIDGRATAYVCVDFSVDLLSPSPRRFGPCWRELETRASFS